MISKISNWYFSKGALPYWCILILDCLTIIGSNILVYALNNGTLYTLQNIRPLITVFSLYLLCYIVGFRIFHTYSGIIRYSSFIDLQRVGLSMLIGLMLIMGLKYGLHSDSWIMAIRMKDIGLAAILATILMCGIRVTVKYLYDFFFSSGICETGFYIWGKSRRYRAGEKYQKPGCLKIYFGGFCI